MGMGDIGHLLFGWSISSRFLYYPNQSKSDVSMSNPLPLNAKYVSGSPASYMVVA